MIGAAIGALATKAIANATNNVAKKKSIASAPKSNASNSNYTDPSVYKNLLGGSNLNEHANYINKTYAGGLDSYTKLQNDRYAEALKNNNVDLLNKLNSDAKRVGYSLNTPKQQPLPIMEMPEMPELNLPEYKPFSYQDFLYGKEFNYDDFNYKDFTYDVNKDQMYNVYKDMYARQGQAAGDKALANTAAATGGMPSSYAAAANAQAQQAYAKKTADMIPVLEGQAYDRYSNERGFSYQNYLNDRNLEYDKFYNDKNFAYTDYLNDRNLAYGDHQNIYNSKLNNAQAGYNDAWQRINYTDSRNDLAYDRNKQQEAFDYEKFLNNQNRDDTLAQRDVDNKYRQNAFDWNVQTDTRDYNYNAGQDAIRNSLSKDDNARAWEQFEYNKTQDELARQEQIEAAGKEKNADDEKAAQRQKSEQIVKDSITELLKSPNPADWLKDKGAFLTDDEYNQVIKRLKDLNVIINEK